MSAKENIEMTHQQQIVAAADRMAAWAEDHPECDTQGIMGDEWYELARAALGLPILDGEDSAR